MSFVSTIRAGLSYTAYCGSAFCLWQVPLIWQQQEESLRSGAEAWRDLLRDALVVVDAGHGGVDGGTQGNGVLEKHCTLEIARRVEEQILRHGMRTIMTRRDDRYVSLEERSAVANSKGASLFVSIHLNADATSGETAGLETYYSSRKRLGDLSRLRDQFDLPPGSTFKDHRSFWLARKMQSAICQATGSADRNARDSNYLVVMQSECPAVLIECGYLTNADEARRLQDPAHQEKIAVAVAATVKNFLLAARLNPRRGIVVDSVVEATPSGALSGGNP
jgi:N-acetylmuramoyl-L-alanine amidase